jgi:16S rRNA (uracil1498-N3)-methyltransferase
MNLILISPGELRQDRIAVFKDDRRCRHLNQVLRSRAGDVVRVGLIDGPLGTARILAISLKEVIIDIEWQKNDPPVLSSTDLILALPRPIMLKRIMFLAASMGVGRIFLLNANRVEKSFFAASMLQKEAFKEHLLLGLEQAVATRLPIVSVHPRFRPFVEDILPGMTDDYQHLLLAHPSVDERLPQVVSIPLIGRLLLALGPEGGWVDFEIEKFKERRFLPFTMGPRILRLETAVCALLAQVDLLRQLSSTDSPEQK